MLQIDRNRLDELLDELFRRAREQQVMLEDVYIVGGAAMMLQLDRDRMTGDIDGVLNPSEDLRRIAESMWEQYELAPDWLNNNFLVFASTMQHHLDTEAAEMTVHGYRIRIASPRYLLAMKIAADRAKDYDDISGLVWHLDLWDRDQIVELTVEVLGDDGIAYGIAHDIDVREDLGFRADDAIRRARAHRPRWLSN